MWAVARRAPWFSPSRHPVMNTLNQLRGQAMSMSTTTPSSRTRTFSEKTHVLLSSSSSSSSLSSTPSSLVSSVSIPSRSFFSRNHSLEEVQKLMQKLNDAGQYKKACTTYETCDAKGNPTLRAEYMIACIHTNRKPIELTSADAVNARKAPDAPVKVEVMRSKFGWIGILLYAGLFFLAFKYLTSGSGGMLGDVLSQQTFQKAEKTNVFDDVKGLDEVIEQLQEVVDFLQMPDQFEGIGAKMPKGILLSGPPGTGKTLMARAIAGEAGVPFFYASGSNFEEMLVGLGARRVRELFKTARDNAPCIVFIDEIDSIGRKRENIRGGGSETLNQLLTELDGFQPRKPVFFVAATNMAQQLDSALTRAGRFDKLIEVPLPDISGREKIFEYYLAKVRHNGNIDLKKLIKRTYGFSGADIENSINIAAISTVRGKKEEIDTESIMEAIDQVNLGLKKKNFSCTDDERRLTAFHESGHAICAMYTPGGHSIVKATIVPRDRALGLVEFQPNSEISINKQELLASIVSAMGGRAAEEILVGPEKVSAGASSDFENATKRAYAMVSQLGMSERIGHVNYSNEQWQLVSEEQKKAIDSEANRIIEECYSQAKSLLIQKKKEWTSLAEALLEHETLDVDEINLVVAGKPIV